jgi:predicted DNA-binding transcriptional regulator AlpA
MSANHSGLSPNVQSPALSIPQAGRFLGCGRSLIYGLIGSGDLPARKLGRRTVVLRRDAEALLERLPLAPVTVTPRAQPFLAQPAPRPAAGAIRTSVRCRSRAHSELADAAE